MNRVKIEEAYLCDLEGQDVNYSATIGFWPYDPGVSSGPPEYCYPPEGGEVEDVCNERFWIRFQINADSEDDAEFETVDFTRDELKARMGLSDVEFDTLVDNIHRAEMDQYEDAAKADDSEDPDRE